MVEIKFVALAGLFLLAIFVWSCYLIFNSLGTERPYTFAAFLAAVFSILWLLIFLLEYYDGYWWVLDLNDWSAKYRRTSWRL